MEKALPNPRPKLQTFLRISGLSGILLFSLIEFAICISNKSYSMWIHFGLICGSILFAFLLLREKKSARSYLMKKRSIVVLTIIWSIIVVGTWLISSINCKSPSNYYIIWTLGSLISIIVFGAFFVLVNTPGLVKMIADNNQTKNIKLLFRVTVLIVVVLTIAGIVAILMLFFELFYIKEDLLMKLYMEYRIDIIHLLQLITVFSFGVGDLFCFKSIEDIEKPNNLVQIGLRREKSLLWQTLIFVDAPSAVTILFLYIFSKSNNSLPFIDTFMGGSEAFALISFNLVYIVIILELGHKYHILTEKA